MCRAIISDSALPIVYHSGPAKANLDPVSEKAKKVGWHSVSYVLASILLVDILLIEMQARRY